MLKIYYLLLGDVKKARQIGYPLTTAASIGSFQEEKSHTVFETDGTGESRITKEPALLIVADSEQRLTSTSHKSSIDTSANGNFKTRI